MEINLLFEGKTEKVISGFLSFELCYDHHSNLERAYVNTYFNHINTVDEFQSVENNNYDSIFVNLVVNKDTNKVISAFFNLEKAEIKLKDLLLKDEIYRIDRVEIVDGQNLFPEEESKKYESTYDDFFGQKKTNKQTNNERLLENKKRLNQYHQKKCRKG